MSPVFSSRYLNFESNVIVDYERDGSKIIFLPSKSLSPSFQSENKLMTRRRICNILAVMLSPLPIAESLLPIFNWPLVPTSAPNPFGRVAMIMTRVTSKARVCLSPPNNIPVANENGRQTKFGNWKIRSEPFVKCSTPGRAFCFLARG